MKTLKKWQLGSLFVIIQVVVLGCSVSGPLRNDQKAEGYGLSKLPTVWNAQGVGGSGADQVYVSKKTKALISVNSVCDRYPDSKLENLSEDLLSPISNPTIVTETELTISSRRALHRHVKGSLDGVPVETHLIVLRKNKCLFDFSIFGKSISNDDFIDFMNFAKSLRFQESP